MIEFKKEIRLSDLVRKRRASRKRRNKQSLPSRQEAVAPARSRRAIVGLKLGATQIAAARVVNNGTGRAAPASAAAECRSGTSTRAKSAT